MADRTKRPARRRTTPAREPVFGRNIVKEAAASSVSVDGNGRHGMNMMTKINASQNERSGSRSVDQDGNPSDHSGPDLRKAKPIAEMLGNLKHRKTGKHGTYAVEFYREACASGIHLTTGFDKDGIEYLMALLPCDSQVEMRNIRYEALFAHMRANPRRRQDVIDICNFLGRFTDDRAFSSLEEGVNEYLAGGGRIYVLPDGQCEHQLPGAACLEDEWNDYKLRRLHMRFGATIRRNGGLPALRNLVYRRGAFHSGSGRYVLPAGEVTDGKA